MSSTVNPLDALGLMLGYLVAVANKTFVAPAGSFAFLSLLTALAISAVFLLWRRAPARRRVRPKALRRALLPRRLLNHPSTKADMGFLVFNVFLFGLMFGWTIVAAKVVSGQVSSGLSVLFGTGGLITLAEPIAIGLVTFVLFMAYELAYWLDHYLKHRIPFLWEFHKVHHSAEVLTPATNARMHPVDTIIYYNITAVIMGIAGGVMLYLLGRPVKPFLVWDENVIALVFAYSVSHLHHSHMWIAFTGIWGKIFLSPAHHQIHHSLDPRHFDKNMGGSLALFDWLFGTLFMPSRKPQKLSFGVSDTSPDPHSVIDSIIKPLGHAAGHLYPGKRPGEPDLGVEGRDSPTVVRHAGAAR